MENKNIENLKILENTLTEMIEKGENIDFEKVDILSCLEIQKLELIKQCIVQECIYSVSVE
ncbi:MAG: hypothetical protein RLZZ453_930 [Chlamydiota bacterium]|jgi:hypothetical protein